MDLDTSKEPRPTADEYDVVVVGGGAAGLAAALFAARYGFETVVFDRGQSAIRQSYAIENYLGFLGIKPKTFLELGRAHARFEGCEIVDDFVVEVAETETGFRVRTQDDAAVDASYVIAASAYNADYLAELRDGSFHDAGDHPVDCEEATGSTEIEGLYVAGWLSGSPHQVLISAGHGGRVAKTVIHDHRRRRLEYWDEVARYWDWCVKEGQYGDEEWERHVDEWVDETLPDDHDYDAEHVERVRREIKAERLGFEQCPEARRRRLERGEELLCECLDVPDDAQ